MSDSVNRRLVVRTCSRRWLRIKLHFLVTRDEKGMREFNALLDDVAGRRVGIGELMLAVMLFLGDSADDNTLAIMLYTFLCVPFWQWSKLRRLMKIADAQLGG